jgi:hypothetical protein
MKIKNLKTKHLVALALALFMVMPMLLVNVRATPTYPASGTPPYLDVVPTGGAASQTTTNIPVQAVGTTFSVDVRVDNYADVNIGGTNNGVSGASYIVTWNPAVLTFDSYTDGSWLPSQSNLGDISASTSEGQLTIGQIAFGSSAQLTADNSAGSVSCTITFTVASTGTTIIGLEPEGSGVPYLIAPIATSTTGQPVPGTLTFNALYNPLTTISLYQHGTSSNTIQFPTSENPIGQTFQVDIYINNPLAVAIWGWNLGLTWNPAAIQLTSVTEGTYLAGTSPTGNQQGSTTLFVPGYINNQVGDIPQGISDVYLSYTTQTTSAGVLATLTFTVINYASSNINLVAGIPSLETLTGTPAQTPTAVSPAPVLNNAQYITNPPPPPQSPVAKITNTDSGVTYTNGQVIVTPYNGGFTFDLSAVNSVAGSDVVPQPSESTNPITGYSWTFTASPSGQPALFTSPTTTETLTFTTPTVSAVTTYTVQLVVTAPQVATPNDPNYNPTSEPVTFQFQVQPPSVAPTTAGPLLDVYVVNPTTATTTNPMYSPNGLNGNPLAYGTSAYTANQYCDAFGPQQLMTLDGLVTYNGAPVANQEVTFTINSNTGAVMATLTALTGENGIATVSYRLPWVDGTYSPTSGPPTEFGIWSVFGSSEVQQTIVTDTMAFDFGDIISITGVSINSPSIARSTATIPTSNTVRVTLSGISAQTQQYWLTYTVNDAGNVPIASGMLSALTMPAAQYSETSSGTLTVNPSSATQTFTFNIPSYAFVGTATVYINIFNQNPNVPADQAVAYTPQASGTFTIAIPYSQASSLP